MKVYQLIIELKKQDPDSEVMVHDYLGGVNKVRGVTNKEFVKTIDPSFFYGSHELMEVIEHMDAEAIDIDNSFCGILIS